MFNSDHALFTVCSNNYLGKAKVLFDSIKVHEPTSRFYIFLCDLLDASIDYKELGADIIVLKDIEPEMPILAARYTVVELNTCVKPTAFEFLLSKGFLKIIFLDPDIKLFLPLKEVFDALDNASVVLTPHICSPTPQDSKTPAEAMFNNFGIYNLGFIGVSSKSESSRFLSWWKYHTYKQCFIDVYNGIFLDQLVINQAPLFFQNVLVLKSKCLNMAPWNLHERVLVESNGYPVIVGEGRLVFYHFSSFQPGQFELPLKLYNRYTFEERVDLHSIYKTYSDELNAAGYDRFVTIPYAYQVLRQQEMLKHKKFKWKKKIGRILRFGIR